MKAREAISRAFAEVTQSKAPIQDVELSDGLRYLNRMMARPEFVALGYTSLSSVDDEMTVANGVILGIVKNLSLTLWPQYSINTVNPLIKFSAKRSLGTMLAQAITIIQPAQFPSTTPIGSGNYDGRYTDPFYSNTEGKSTYIGTEDD
jgi:hypothetical protein